MSNNSRSVSKIAKDRLYSTYPELKGRKITNKPTDKKYKEALQRFYKEAKEEKANLKSKGKPPANNLSTVSCAASGNTSPSTKTNSNSNKGGTTKTCKFSSLIVNKNDRQYVLTIIAGEKDPSKQLLEVVGGQALKPAEIKGTLVGLAQSGTTCNHTKATYNPLFDKSSLLSQPSLTEMSFKAYGPIPPTFRIWNATPVFYSFNVSTCESSSACRIAVYPDKKINATIEFPKPEYKNENKLTPKKDSDYLSLENEKAKTWGVGVSGSIEEDGIAKSVSIEFKKEIEKIEKISTISKQLQSHLAIIGNGGKTEPVSFTIKFPNLKFSYQGSWVEIPGSPLCDFQNELSIMFDPLIGVDIDVDIIAAAAIAIGGPLGKLVMYIRKLAKKNIDISFNFILGGEASGGWTGKYNKNEKVWKSSDTELTVKISATLTAKVAAKLDLVIAYIGGGVQGDAKGSVEFKASVNQQAELTITYNHNGLILTGCVYVQAGFKNIFSDDEETEPQGKIEITYELIDPQENPYTIYP